jgi:peptidoglycan L-alanyl-D-glutamate endopeptidase CwlK
LSPKVKARAVAFLDECKACGLDILIYCTLRTNAEQEKIYRVGRDVSGAVLTNARAGESLHNPDENGEAWAFDAVPTVGGKPLWNDKQKIALMGECGEAVGLVWAGRWRGKLRESVHFQGEK